jgi:hypothetical protein
MRLASLSLRIPALLFLPPPMTVILNLFQDLLRQCSVVRTRLFGDAEPEGSAKLNEFSMTEKGFWFCRKRKWTVILNSFQDLLPCCKVLRFGLFGFRIPCHNVPHYEPECSGMLNQVQHDVVIFIDAKYMNPFSTPLELQGAYGVRAESRTEKVLWQISSILPFPFLSSTRFHPCLLNP